MAVFAFYNTHNLHQLSFFNGESTSSATPPPKRAVNSCGIENILEITDACGSGNPKSNGTAICATPMYRIKNLPVAATTKAIICAVCLCPQCRLPMKCQVNMRVMFPAMINGIRLQSGPIPISFAMTGEMTATQSPDIIPQVITETTSSIFTTDPVIMVFPKEAVAACNTTSKAIKTAVRVILSVFPLLLFMVLISFLLLFNCHYSIICPNHLLHTQQN